ncbi:unnamed protein product, partial [Laminaria digitata]
MSGDGCHDIPKPQQNQYRGMRVWWSQSESNRRPLACHASALPTEL